MRGAGAAWPVATARGSAAELHAASAHLVAVPPVERLVRLLEATDRCVVLGSSQPAWNVDGARAEAAGVAVARRTSGGAAVMVGPGEAMWVDVVVPAGDRLSHPDVGRAGWWLGDVWAGALRRAGVGGVQTWRGPLVSTAWSDRVCFAGLGPGEVTVRGRKVVGLAQRRTRAGALLQCALLVRWAPAELLDVLDLPGDERAAAGLDLAGAASGLGSAVAGATMEAFLAGVQEV